MIGFGDWGLICERTEEIDWHPVVGACGFHVPLMILDLMEGDGPTADCLELTRKRSEKILRNADDFLYGGKGAGEMLIQLTEAIAVMSFLPGGIKIFGFHWQAVHWGDFCGLNGGQDNFYATSP